jgi:hypothetical protein
MKYAMICFRIGKRLRLALERISEEDRRSLSSTVEYILHDHLARRALDSLGKERRRHARRTISEPALLRDAGGLAYPGMACDVSAGGICVSAPADFPAEVGSEICVVFALPDIESPLTVKCAPSHMRPQAGRVRLGASFIDDGSPAYEMIRRCMMN